MVSGVCMTGFCGTDHWSTVSFFSAGTADDDLWRLPPRSHGARARATTRLDSGLPATRLYMLAVGDTLKSRHGWRSSSRLLDHFLRDELHRGGARILVLCDGHDTFASCPQVSSASVAQFREAKASNPLRTDLRSTYGNASTFSLPLEVSD
jgi:hypothetical protein